MNKKLEIIEHPGDNLGCTWYEVITDTRRMRFLEISKAEEFIAVSERNNQREREEMTWWAEHGPKCQTCGRTLPRLDKYGREINYPSGVRLNCRGCSEADEGSIHDWSQSRPQSLT